MQFAFRLFAEVEARFTSVERLLYYITAVKPEDEIDVKKESSKDWLQNGSIEFDSVSVCFISFRTVHHRTCFYKHLKNNLLQRRSIKFHTFKRGRRFAN